MKFFQDGKEVYMKEPGFFFAKGAVFVGLVILFGVLRAEAGVPDVLKAGDIVEREEESETRDLLFPEQDTIVPWIIGAAPYGSYRGHLAYFEDEIEIQGNGSRLGFEFYASRGTFRIFAGAELSIILFRGGFQFNAEAVTDGGFLIPQREQSGQVFATRLGYLGLDFGRGGKLTIGKQWSAYYDITSYTDKFNVYGGQGSATYVAATDGGGLGTGRADQAISYRNSFWRFDLTGQLQFRSALNREFFDGVSFSVQLNILDGLKVGAAYNRAFLDEALYEGSVPGLAGDPEYISYGANYRRGGLDIGVVFARQVNGDLSEVYSPAERDFIANVFDANGLEAFAKYRFGKWGILGGLNVYNPVLSDQFLIDPDFRTEYYVLGAEFHPLEKGYFYTEMRLDKSVDANGIKGFSVFTLGLRYDFSWKVEQDFYPESGG